MGRIGDDLGPPSVFRFDARDHSKRGGRDHGAGPQRIDRNALACELRRQPGNGEAHAELGHRVSKVRRQPARLRRQRRRQHQDMRVVRLQEMRQARLADAERAACVDLMHQVEALHRRVERPGQIDGAGIVDADVDAAEGRHGLLDGRSHGGLVSYVDGYRQGPTAGVDDRLGRAVDRPRKLGVWAVGLRQQGDVGAVACRPEGDGQADASAGAGNQQRATAETGHCDGSPSGRLCPGRSCPSRSSSLAFLPVAAPISHGRRARRISHRCSATIPTTAITSAIQPCTLMSMSSRVSMARAVKVRVQGPYSLRRSGARPVGGAWSCRSPAAFQPSPY